MPQDTPSAPDFNRIKQIFFPYTELKTREVISEGNRFVYYTTADTATSILKNKQIWMRNTSAMNDYLEVEHGFDCLHAAYKEASGNSFNAVLNTCFSGLADELRNFFDGWLPTVRRETYITCLSEHLRSEDQNGRLSMWRAYGGETGIALVLKGDVMFNESNALNVFSSPVAYLTPDAFAARFKEIAENMQREQEFITNLGRDVVKNLAFNMLLFGILCTKHPGFHEEREWRVVASPAIYPTQHATYSVEVIRGTPQAVLKLDLKNHPDQGLVGLAIPELLDRLIIGPCQFPHVISGAFHRILQEAGVSKPESKIIVSDIPLRQP